jgi:Cys-tRNA(Pro)/Cys-tRNA(Cys) deacylase
MGGKKGYPLYLEETAQLWDEISVSAGVRGCQMVLAPSDLVRVTGAVYCAIARFP